MEALHTIIFMYGFGFMAVMATAAMVMSKSQHKGKA